MSSNDDGTRQYFDRVTDSWDALYDRPGSIRHRVNTLLRPALYERYRLTFQECGSIEGTRVLDIGCGTGRYSIEFASRGAAHVVGVDFAPSMITYSEESAEAAGVHDRCEFICGDFLSLDFSQTFDIVLAVGLFDYIQDAQALLKRIAAITSGRFLGSFPSYTGVWRTLRKARYHLVKGVNIFDYDASDLERMVREAGFDSLSIMPMTRGLFVVADLKR
jgi:cyclopropane fatty-acyl-phospholipid synthase-like methyltransferase